VSYEVYTTRTVEKAIARLPGDAHDRMNEAIDALAEDPRPVARTWAGATATASGSASGGRSTESTTGSGESMWSESRTGARSTAAEAPSPHRPGPIGHGKEKLAA
jgi:hypothetical protein